MKPGVPVEVLGGETPNGQFWIRGVIAHLWTAAETGDVERFVVFPDHRRYIITGCTADAMRPLEPAT